MSGLPGNMSDGSFPIPRARLHLDAGAAAAAAAFLPSTAPVSSLLPQLPNHPSHLSMVNHSAAAIQAQIAALLTQGAVASSPLPAVGNPLLTTSPVPLVSANVNMHGWTADQIENHIKLLRQCKQHVPQSVTMLLHEAKKRAEKRHAKRIANRKSACSSRARKKALVQEMTELNTRLRRQALILSLLPDLVIVVDVEGTITFCSAQVERVLQHNVDDLVGAKLMDIVVPGSRDRLSNFIQEVLSPKGMIKDDRKTLNGDNPRRAHKKKSKANMGLVDEEAAQMTSGESANAVTDSSFPLSVVQVEQTDTTPGSSDENDNSDESNSKQPSSLTTNSITGNSGSDGGITGTDGRAAAVKKGAGSSLASDTKLNKDHVQRSDSSNTSSNTESSEAKNLLTANANLERNVRWHNKKNMKASKRDGFTDDVLGAAVTANNASARLSSLRHRTSDSEEDSGYRESNDSREETSSSEGEASSQSNGRRKPVAPTCNVCLIRDDLTTIWCEVTSSVRTRDIEEEIDDSASLSNGEKVKKPTSLPTEEVPSRKRCRSDEGSLHESEDVALDDVVEPKQCKEVLLCLRPIRDGEEKSGEAHRFKPLTLKKSGQYFVSADNSGGESNTSPLDGEEGAEMKITKSRSKSTPKKKRSKPDEEIDQAVVESLMSMSSKKSK